MSDKSAPKVTEPRVLHEFFGDDLRNKQIADMPGGVSVRTLMKGGIWSPWAGADAQGREIARLAADNRAKDEEIAGLRSLIVELADRCEEYRLRLGGPSDYGWSLVQRARAAISPKPEGGTR